MITPFPQLVNQICLGNYGSGKLGIIQSQKSELVKKISKSILLYISQRFIIFKKVMSGQHVTPGNIHM